MCWRKTEEWLNKATHFAASTTLLRLTLNGKLLKSGGSAPLLCHLFRTAVVTLKGLGGWKITVAGLLNPPKLLT